MADSTQRLIRELFDAASDLPAQERRAWVEARAGGNPEVVTNVMRLLSAASASGQGFLAEPAWKREQPAMQEGMMIGPYRVLRELGSGGMGVVYLTMRSDEVYRRLAALKVIRPELRANPIQDRFLREREILARLDHPNIARIIDGGTTSDGLPYFVMDYIDGQPLDEFCRNNRVPMEQRLDLFRQICEAVQYLHDNRVLHRDLKPANILVTHNGQVKLLDFGVSKLSSELSGELAGTATTGMPILTAGYASPEQITSQPVTEASDIYSLGVVLYELLTGVRPLKFDGLGLQDILAAVTTETPPRPSTQKLLPEEADPGHLLAAMRPRLTGDLDSIVLMALRKEPERRYLSAREFAADILRFQQGRAVIARGEGSLYRAGRVARRHRLAIAAILLIAISLSGGGLALKWAIDERAQIATLKALTNEIASQHSKMTTAMEKATDTRIAVPHGQLQQDLDHVTWEIETRTKPILQDRFPPRAETKEFFQQSLSYFSDVQTAVGDDPESVAALGRAYLALAQTQWSPEHPSLNEKAQAVQTCTAALKLLSGKEALAKNPDVAKVYGDISSLLEQNPLAHQDLSSTQN